MRKNFGPKPHLFPQPVLILAAYDEAGVPCAMNAAWGGISGWNEISMCISARHKTTENVLLKKAFTVSMATADFVKECDYVGVVSGNDVPNKLEIAGFHTVKSEFVDAPVIEELKMTLECSLKSYDPETGCMVGEIVNVSAHESVLNEDGNVCPYKLQPILFDSMNKTYMTPGEVVGHAFKDGFLIK